MQARALVATVKPRDIVGKSRRRLAVELISELEGIDKKIKSADKDLKALVDKIGSQSAAVRASCWPLGFWSRVDARP